MKRSARQGRDNHLRFETLEARRFMAGNLSARYVGGDLRIQGDSADNQVSIFQTAAAKVRVEGHDGTTINGRAFVDFNLIGDDLMVVLGQGGTDRVTVNGSVRVPDDLAIFVAAGEVLLDGTRGKILIGGDADIRAGMAGSAKLLNEVVINGNLHIDAGETAQLVAGQARRVPFSVTNFSNSLNINNPNFPLVPGSRYRYEATEVDPETGATVFETVDVEVLNQTRNVGGVTARVVRDTVKKNGVLVEKTLDWYAQDNAGNVWYLGEIATNYEYDDAGNLLGTNDDGSWETGMDGALPGIQMPATPHIGDRYYQEFRPQIAIDQGDVLSLTESISNQVGSFTNVLKTRDWTALTVASLEHKYFVPGLGSVRTEKLNFHTGKIERTVNLVQVTLNGVPVSRLTNPATFNGSSNIGKGSELIRVAGQTKIRQSGLVFVDGGRFTGRVDMQATSEMGVRDSVFAARVSARSGGELSLQRSTGLKEVYLSGDTNVNVCDSDLRHEFEVKLGRGDNKVVVSTSRLAELQIDGLDGVNTLHLDNNSLVTDMELVRIRMV